uniref:Envelope protein n=1 Tax=Leptobrachium leishanense TaxID=445787 RepID=A0A8C5P6J8_9ANUR
MGYGTSDAVVNRWGYKPDSAARRRSSEGQSLLNRMTLIGRGGWRCSIRSGAQTVQLTLTIQHPSQADTGVYIMGIYATATTKFPRYKFKLQDMAIYKKEENPFLPRKYGEVVRPPPLLPNTKSIANPTYEDSIVMETGFSDANVWLEWVKFSALNNNRTNCYVCGAARPHLGTVPFNIPQDVEECFLSLYTNTTDSQSLCEYWKNSYPILTRLPQPGEGIHVYPGNYTCYRSAEKGRNLTFFPEGYCANYSNINSTKLQNQVFLIGDLYWICGDLKIRARLPLQWSGECALAKAIMGFHIVSDPEEIPNISSRRRKREVPSPQGSLDPHVYVDAIGVPRGVPDEFKARDQVKAGFESFLAPLVTINKNVDWINYLYYNQQRFVNYTREALQGLADQLQSTSIMTFQNRMALDMILAEKGGVCKMIEGTGTCCTYIPDNVGPNGKVTRAIKKLTELSEEMKRNSGIDNPWDQYFGWFKGWRQALIQLGIILLLIVLCIAVIVYCLMPCLKRMMAKGNPTTMMYSTPLPSTPNDYAEYVQLRRIANRK